jgi:hypothetical protein
LAPSSNGVALMAGLGASGAGFAAGGAPGMAVGAFSPAVGYLAKKAADRITTGAMDRLGDLARVGGDASALQAPLNAVQSAARSAAAPVSAAITNGVGRQKDLERRAMGDLGEERSKMAATLVAARVGWALLQA